MNTPTSNAVGWYVHLPFCTTKCGYCDFYSLPTIPALVGGLVEALVREMTLRDPRRPVESVFIGGGTPTVLPAAALSGVLEAVRDRTGAAAEFTVEANPSSADELKLNLLRNHDVNRISFGAQSFDARELAVLERIHDPSHIPDSIALARRAGFDNINLDLIYAIPGQTLENWRRTLRRAIDLETEHLSCYALMYEPGTALTRQWREGRVRSCDESLEAEMFELTIDELESAGYEHYEISNFARPGRRCRANLIYWENREYLGIGPSAVSYLEGVRTKNVPDVRRYVEGMIADPDTVVVEREQLPPLASAGETAVQMLRLTEGMRYDRFEALTGLDARVAFAGPIAQYAQLGLLTETKQSVRLSRRGLLLANQVMEGFLVSDDT